MTSEGHMYDLWMTCIWLVKDMCMTC